MAKYYIIKIEYIVWWTFSILVKLGVMVFEMLIDINELNREIFKRYIKILNIDFNLKM